MAALSSVTTQLWVFRPELAGVGSGPNVDFNVVRDGGGPMSDEGGTGGNGGTGGGRLPSTRLGASHMNQTARITYLNS